MLESKRFSLFQGVGKNCKSISDYVWGMRIVNSDGELVEYNKDMDPEMMKPVQVSSRSVLLTGYFPLLNPYTRESSC